MIPKIIHQTWKETTIPPQWLGAVTKCKDIHPTYEYKLWTDFMMDEFIRTHYKWFHNTYISYPYNIQRCDAFRYFIMYHYGGIYLDLDVYCNQSLEPLLSYEIVLAKSYSFFRTTYTNSFMMSIPKHPFFLYCIQHLKSFTDKHYWLGKHFHIMSSAGPYFLNDMVRFYRPSVYILSQEEFAGDCTLCNENKCKGGRYFKHIVGESWQSADSHFYNKMLCNSNFRNRILCVSFIFVLMICMLIYLFVRMR